MAGGNSDRAELTSPREVSMALQPRSRFEVVTLDLTRDVLPTERAGPARELQRQLLVEEAAAAPRWSMGGQWLRRSLPVAVVLGASVIGYLWAQSQPEVYRASATVVVQPTAADRLLERTLDGDVSEERIIATERAIAGSNRISDLVEEELGRDVDYDVTTGFGANILEIRGEGATADDAADVANQVASTYLEQRRLAQQDSLRQAATELQEAVRELDGADPAASPTTDAALAATQEQLTNLQLEQALSSTGAQLVVPAEPPSGPSEPRPSRSAVSFGLVAAFALLAVWGVRRLRAGPDASE